MKALKQKPIPQKEYNAFLKIMGDVLSDEILENGIVQLPWGLGDIYLKINNGGRTYDYKNKHIHFNDHTDGDVRKFFWLSPERKSKKFKIWLYSVERTLKRNLPVKLIHENKKYPDFDKMLKMM
jgi:hypothetical protein